MYRWKIYCYEPNSSWGKLLLKASYSCMNSWLTSAMENLKTVVGPFLYETEIVLETDFKYPTPLGGVDTQYGLCEGRLKTFDNWPKYLSPSRSDLARAGFIYSGKGDKVQCVFCGVILKDWAPGDIPMEEHSRWAEGKCPFVKMCWSGNDLLPQPLCPWSEALLPHELLCCDQ